MENVISVSPHMVIRRYPVAPINQTPPKIGARPADTPIRATADPNYLNHLGPTDLRSACKDTYATNKPVPHVWAKNRAAIMVHSLIRM